VTPVISIYCIVAAEPYFAGFFGVRRVFLFTLRVSYGFPVKPELVLLRKHAPETAETQQISLARYHRSSTQNYFDGEYYLMQL
jgi:hypothetical protein